MAFSLLERLGSLVPIGGRWPALRTFVLFVGYPRSGHSLMGALINTHPSAIVSHELDVLGLVEAGKPGRTILHRIEARDRWFARRGREWAGYQYDFGPAARKPRREITVIGDKKGASTTARLAHAPELLDRLAESVGLQLRLIHHIRDPFDAIATIARRGPHPYGSGVAAATKFFFDLVAINEAIASQRPADIRHVYHEQLIERPREVLGSCLEFIGLNPERLDWASVGKGIFPSPSSSRDSVEWTGAEMDEVETCIDTHPLLDVYRGTRRPGTPARPATEIGA
ncbi:MAG: hypothetical protein H6810_04215 [Phycisphaeraceae bacterium]|nr:MAG: hypothetical protein H6810_04215 [Phycisphaeraceae bacterium]